MTSGSPTSTTTPQQSGPGLRMTLKPEAPATGQVDGAWWPRSRDLSAELPALLAALTARLGAVERSTYHLDGWNPAGTKLATGGRTVRLDGFRSQRPGTVTLVGTGMRRLTLLVVPPETTDAAAAKAMRDASLPGGDDSVDSLIGDELRRTAPAARA
ncbi:hypothetical protein GCM10022380_60630 [Amycolatopsis tucumanensis]|uniref:Uncharacterized protein n=2 Tax=Pseudonocardiaceae TaxID=2070 RepID=A0ABP7J528_9PSEU